MTQILFVCHGNICRSPMAEFVMKNLVRNAGVEDQFSISSCGVSQEEVGKDLYPSARLKLCEKNIPVTAYTARQMTQEDYDQADLIIAMDEQNVRWINHQMGGDAEHKVRLLLSYAGRNEGVSDPWYSGDFEKAYTDILEGCTALLQALTMKHILFVCHGNICRSPMAEFIMKDLLRKAGLEQQILVASCGVSQEELDKDIYPSAILKLNEKGIPYNSRCARQISEEDYHWADLILAMDTQNIRWINRLLNGDPDQKVHLLMEYTGSKKDVSDPWYSGDFELAYQDILEGCTALLNTLTQ